MLRHMPPPYAGCRLGGQGRQSCRRLRGRTGGWHGTLVDKFLGMLPDFGSIGEAFRRENHHVSVGMSIDRVRLGAVVLVAAAAVGLAGCTGGDPAPTSSTSTTSTSATTSPPSTSTTTTAPPTTSATGMPAAAKAHTPAGAEAFVRYFNDQVNLAWTEPSVALLPPLCLSTSKTCAGWQEAAQALQSAHQHFDAPPASIQDLVREGAGSGGSLRFEVHGQRNAAHVVDAAGKVVKSISAMPSSLVYYVIWDGRWQIQEVKAGI